MKPFNRLSRGQTFVVMSIALGVLLGAPAVVVEFALRRHFGYQWALTIFEIGVIVSLFLIFGLGPEHKGRDFSA